jgi:hypothetical protein
MLALVQAVTAFACMSDKALRSAVSLVMDPIERAFLRTMELAYAG